MGKIKIFDFIDTKTGEKFTGTKMELAEHAGIANPTVCARIKTGRLIATEIGAIDNSPKLIFTRIVNGKPDVFVGTKMAAAKYYGLTDWFFRRDIEKGEIIVDNSVIVHNNKNNKKDPLYFITNRKSDPETKRKLTKRMYDVLYAMGI